MHVPDCGMSTTYQSEVFINARFCTFYLKNFLEEDFQTTPFHFYVLSKGVI